MTITEQRLFPVAPDEPAVGTPCDAPRTSVKAAALAWPRTGTQRMMVLTAIACALDGLTDMEIVHRAGLPINVVNPRRGELVSLGWVVNSGQARASLGHGAGIIWTLSPAGLRMWGDLSI